MPAFAGDFSEVSLQPELMLLPGAKHETPHLCFSPSSLRQGAGLHTGNPMGFRLRTKVCVTSSCAGQDYADSWFPHWQSLPLSNLYGATDNWSEFRGTEGDAGSTANGGAPKQEKKLVGRGR